MWNKGNIYYNEGSSITYRISNNSVFSGYPTQQQLLDWGFQLVEQPEKTIEDYKLEKIQDIEAYDKSSEVNSFSIGGMQLWLDASTRQQLKTSVEAYKDQGIEQVTKWFNGQSFTFPVSMWLQMLSQLEIYAAEALNVTEQHKYNVQNLDIIEEIEGYDFTTGYPNKIEL